MRMIFGVVSLLLVVAIAGFLAKQRLIAGSVPPTVSQGVPAGT